ncbi:MAG TPA: leucyl/phenylalanyl-tRNA--protein transferase [Sphingobacteriaceae bacterium]|nr:leucyl/phenylalanyl-tRNA--protein transferase [Sphingobacteriaceae bacterium]
MIYQLEEQLWFPQPDEAEEDGLLAVGGDLSVERLLLAYSQGIFPWFSDETPILWYSPHNRFVIFPDHLHVSKSMQQVLRSGIFRITNDQAFDHVIMSCAKIDRKEQEGTWITKQMQQAYIALHKIGYAHSVEVWKGDALVGGLYGVVIGNVFCGESMFSKVNNASKAAIIWLCKNKGFAMIDCQFHTLHLESLGAEFISRKEYMSTLQD